MIAARLRAFWRSVPLAARWRAAVAGIFGATSGFAVFVLWWEERDTKQSPLIFFLALLVAAIVSFGCDSFRDKVESHREHRSDRPPRVRLSDTVVTVALLAVFEVFILGLHASISLLHSPKIKEIGDLVLGPALEGQSHTSLNLVVMIVLWVGVATVLTVGLALAVFDRPCEPPASCSLREIARWARPTGRAALIGGVLGGVGGPAAVLGVTFFFRTVGEMKLILWDVDAFIQHLAGVDDRLRTFVPAVLTLPITALAWLFKTMTGLVGTPWGPLIALVVSAGFGAVCVRLAFTRDGRFAIPALVIGLAYAVPLVADFGYVLKLAGAAASVWALPGILLGMMLPWLSRPSQNPRIWGFVAFLASVVLFLFAYFAGPGYPAARWFLTAGGMVFLAVGALFQWRGVIEPYWPVLCLSIAIIVFGLTRGIQGADFFNIQREVYALGRSKPVMVEPRPRLTDFASAADLVRWRAPLFTLPPPPSPVWGKMPPWASLYRPTPVAVVVAHAAMSARTGQMTSIKNTLLGRDEALHRYLEGADRPLKDAPHLSLRQQDDYLKTREEGGGALRAEAQALTAEAERHLQSDLVRPIPEESPSWPDPTPPDLTDAWTATLRKEQAEFTASRQAFEASLRDFVAAARRDEGELARHLEELGKQRKQVADQVEWANLLELAMTASVGFWATIGLLTAWAIRHDAAAATPAGASARE